VTESLDPTGDQWEIRQLVERYASAADRADGDAAAALFTEDGVLEVRLDPTRDEVTGIRTGRPEIAAAVGSLRRYRSTHHSISSCVVDGDGDQALGDTRCVAHHVDGDGADAHDRVLFIRYLDSFVRLDGRWQIAVRKLEVQWISVLPVESI
jgi:ketosteroid isomerase-like protein